MSCAVGSAARRRWSAAALSEPPEHATTMGSVVSVSPRRLQARIVWANILGSQCELRSHSTATCGRTLHAANVVAAIYGRVRATLMAAGVSGNFALRLALLDRFSFVVLSFASTETELHLGSPFLEVRAQRNQCQAFFLQFADEPLNFALVKQEFAVASRLVLRKKRPLAVMRDLNVDEPCFTVLEAHEAVNERAAV